MATPSEKFAQSLEVLRKLQEQGLGAIRSGDLTRTHRERLVRNGFLQEVMKGWYIPSRPDDGLAGESTAWYAAFWDFCSTYLEHRFGIDGCLSPEQSISLYAGNYSVPKQLLVRSPKGGNNITTLLHGTSLLDVRLDIPTQQHLEKLNGLRLFSLPAALITCSPEYFTQNPTDARAALSIIRDASEVLPLLLEGGKSVVAGRIAGAFRNIGRERLADEIVKAMRAADYDVRESDPFKAIPRMILNRKTPSPYANRIRLMWQQMRQPVIEIFPPAPSRPVSIKSYLQQVDELYSVDAYNSLSIEGYRVTPELIEQVRSGSWNPDTNAQDRSQRDALVARGYWQAFQAVKESVQHVLNGETSGTVADEDHRDWYRQLFAPCVTAGILGPSELAGYRSSQVYIRRSMHVPPRCEAVRDAMAVLFELLQNEPEPSVRVVLGHFMFVYIHPYMDGNGRMGRFLMNVMLASGDYPWLVIPVEQRDSYMAALEAVSVAQDIQPFAKFLAKLINSLMSNPNQFAD